MRSKEAKEWELKLKDVFDEIDRVLESEYGDRFQRHPNRPAEGRTSNPEMDGLFNVGASFSAGFGSKLGPGYVVDIRMSTLSHQPGALKSELRDRVKVLLEERLPAAFPGKNLKVHTEHKHLRIIGDLSLD